MHGLGQVLDVARGDAGHGDAAILGQVDVKLLRHASDLEKATARGVERVRG